MDKDLTYYRDKIDKIDAQIVDLLNKRADVSKKIGEIKRVHEEEIIDFSREKEVFTKILSESSELIPEGDLKNIYREIIASSRKLQKSYFVSFLGPEGSFSNIAFEKFFGKNTNFNLCKDIKDIFYDVSKSNAKFGIVPVENSIEGSVNTTFDNLFEFNVKIWCELRLRINFDLISFSNSIKSIKKIYSHPHALAQCRNFIKNNFENVELVELSSTSESVHYIKDSSESGAIVSPVAAKIYNVPVLSKNIEDSSNNFTRFFVISNNENQIKEGSKTSFIFSISHQPKMLAKALGVVAKYNLNMCKIESRPIKTIPWEYLFFIDIEGKCSEDFIEDFKKETTFLKKLGTYPLEMLD